MAYSIVTGNTIEILIEKVNLLEKQGWYTQGGVSYSSKEKIYLQAMITGVEFEELNDEAEARPEKSEDDSFKIDESIPREKWDYDFMKIEDLDYLSTAVFVELKKANIHTVGDLLKAIETNDFVDKASDRLKQTINFWIKHYGWKL